MYLDLVVALSQHSFLQMSASLWFTSGVDLWWELYSCPFLSSSSPLLFTHIGSWTQRFPAPSQGQSFLLLLLPSSYGFLPLSWGWEGFLSPPPQEGGFCFSLSDLRLLLPVIEGFELVCGATCLSASNSWLPPAYLNTDMGSFWSSALSPVMFVCFWLRTVKNNLAVSV